MGYYTKRIEKLIANTKFSKNWRYTHAKNFEQAVEIYCDFVIDNLKNLGNFPIDVAASQLLDITPEIKDNLIVTVQTFVLQSRHVMIHIVQEFANLLDVYTIATPLNEESLLSLQSVFKRKEQEIKKEITSIHSKINELKRRAHVTQIENDMAYKKSLPVFNELLKFNFQSLDTMFKTGKLPEIFSLFDE